MRQKFGNEYYARFIKKKYFYSPSIKISKASRIFVLHIADEFDVASIATLLAKIGRKYSHVEHKRTPVEDRFCPYVLLHDVNSDDLIKLKGNLHKSGIKLADGHPFHGAPFSPGDLVIQPTKENLIKLKFIPSALQVELVASSIMGMPVEIFEFYKDIPSSEIQINSAIPHHKIKVDTVYFIGEVI